MDTIEHRVIETVAKVLELPPQQIGLDMMMGDVETWDSLNHTLIITALENEFDVVFDLEQIIEVEGIIDIIELVKQVNGQPKASGT